MKRIVFILSVLFSQIIFPQDIKFEFDYARFRMSGSTVLCEFYYQYDKKTLTVNENGQVGLFISLDLKEKNSNREIEKKYSVNDIYDSSAVSTSAVGEFRLAVPKGEYLISLKVSDKYDSLRKTDIKDELIAKPFPRDKITISDIELAYKITKSNNKNSPFYKNTYEVIPNPEVIFTYLKPTVYYYYEIYGMQNSVSDSLVLITELFSGDGKPLFHSKRKIAKNENDIVKVGQTAMKDFPSDSYLLKISIADVKGKYAYSSIKKFFYVNPKVKKENAVNFAPLADAKLGGMSEEECNKLFREMQYLASRQEKKRYEGLKTVEQKQRFLSDFMKRRDRSPETSRNEYMEEYFKRLKYVNERFRTKTKAGYLTDRGRVYLLYGEPDEIDRYPYTVDSKPYEIWYYNSIEGGVVFVFGDLTGIGDYVLLHSTKRGELYDSNWRERIRAF